MHTTTMRPAGVAVEVSPKRFEWWRLGYRWARALALVLTVISPVALPLILATLMAGPAGAAVVTVATVAVLAGSVRGRGWVRAGWRRVQVIRLGLVWPSIAVRSGIVLPVQRRNQVPKLVAVEVGPGFRPAWLRLRLRPLGPQGPGVWGDIEERVARVTGHATSLHWQDPDRRGDMILVLSRAPLPRTANAPTGVSPDPGVVGLGESAEGGAMTWAPDEHGRSHLAIVGSTGLGKGVGLRNVLRHAAAHGWLTIVCNPKRSGEFAWVRAFGAVARTREGMFAAIFAVHAEMLRRSDLLDTLGVDSWVGQDLGPRVLLVIDELPVVAAMRLGPDPNIPPKEAEAVWRAAMLALAELVAMGRAVGVSVVLVAQHPIAESFGPSGSTLLANIGSRLAVGRLQQEGLHRMFPGASEAVSTTLAAGIPGRCLHRGLRLDDGERTIAGQVWWCDQTTAADAIPPDTRPGPDFDLLPSPVSTGSGVTDD